MRKLISPCRPRSSALAVLALAGLTLAGCSKTAKVSGHVKLGGQDLKLGHISFVGSDGKSSDVVELKNGEYSVHNAPIGECTVVVDTNYIIVENMGMDAAGRGGQVDRGRMGADDIKKMEEMNEKDPRYKLAKEREESWMPIPDEYTDAKKSTLKYTVKRGSQSGADFDMPLPAGWDPEKNRKEFKQRLANELQNMKRK
jgi:hypothetical protein